MLLPDLDVRQNIGEFGCGESPGFDYGIYIYIYIYIYTGCPLKKVGAMVGAWKMSRRTKKSYTILPISQ